MPPVGVIPLVNRLSALFLGDYKKVKLEGLYNTMKTMPMKDRLMLAKSNTEVDWLELAKSMKKIKR